MQVFTRSEVKDLKRMDSFQENQICETSRKITISAVIPSYNRAHKVCNAIRSVLAQSVAVDEIIVIDDGSTDGTKSVLQECFGDRVRVIVHESNQGISAARRTGYIAACGDWIAYLDSDDSWPADGIQKLREVVDFCDSDTVVVFGDMLIFNGKDPDRRHFADTGYRLDGPSCPMESREVVYPVMYPFFQSSLIRRSALQQARIFEEGLRIGEDSLAYAQLTSYGRFVMIPDVTCRHDRTGDDNLSLHVDEISNPDFPMSRILMIQAFNSGHSPPYKRREYAGWVRKWISCRKEAGFGTRIADLMDQFRYHVGIKSFCFFGLVIFRRCGGLLWAGKRLSRSVSTLPGCDAGR